MLGPRVPTWQQSRQSALSSWVLLQMVLQVARSSKSCDVQTSGDSAAAREPEVNGEEGSLRLQGIAKGHSLVQSGWYVHKVDVPFKTPRHASQSVTTPTDAQILDEVASSVESNYEADIHDIKAMLGQDMSLRNSLTFSRWLQRSVLGGHTGSVSFVQNPAMAAEGIGEVPQPNAPAVGASVSDSPEVVQAPTSVNPDPSATNHDHDSSAAPQEPAVMEDPSNATHASLPVAGTSPKHNGRIAMPVAPPNASNETTNGANSTFPFLEALFDDIDVTLTQSICLATAFFFTLFGLCMLLASPRVVPCLDIDDPKLHIFIDFVILMNVFCICIELKQGEDDYTFAFENIFNMIFFFEVCLRLQDNGLQKFMRTPWDVFNILLVIAGSIDLWILPIVDLGLKNTSLSNNQTIKQVVGFFRMLRILRVIRLFRPKPLPPPWEIDDDNPAEAWFNQRDAQQGRGRGKGMGKGGIRRFMRM